MCRHADKISIIASMPLADFRLMIISFLIGHWWYFFFSRADASMPDVADFPLSSDALRRRFRGFRWRYAYWCADAAAADGRRWLLICFDFMIFGALLMPGVSVSADYFCWFFISLSLIRWWFRCFFSFKIIRVLPPYLIDAIDSWCRQIFSIFHLPWCFLSSRGALISRIITFLFSQIFDFLRLFFTLLFTP